MKVLKFIFSLVLSFIPGMVGMHWVPKSGGIDWYTGLNHPLFTPPGWFFSVVWTTLYFLLALAFYRIIKQRHKSKEKILAIELFIVHIILNASWNYIFFGKHLIEFGVILIATLILVAFIMKQMFYRIDMRGGKYVMPYIIWLFCALYLNSGICFLN